MKEDKANRDTDRIIQLLEEALKSEPKLGRKFFSCLGDALQSTLQNDKAEEFFKVCIYRFLKIILEFWFFDNWTLCFFSLDLKEKPIKIFGKDHLILLKDWEQNHFGK